MSSAVAKSLKWTYKVVRSVIFTVIVAVVALFAFLYIALSIPPVQNMIRERATAELSVFLGSDVQIDGVSISPLNEVTIEGAHVFDLQGKECLRIGRLGAGINVWRLIFSGRIEITYVELIDFTASVSQPKPDSPLNIDFIIKAFAPKDKNKPPTQFDLMIHNIVLRGGTLNYDRLWLPQKPEGLFDSNHIELTGLSADVALPRLSNDLTEVDLRRLSFNEKSGLQVKEIGGLFIISPQAITVEDFNVRLPQSVVRIANLRLPMAAINDFKNFNGTIPVSITESSVTPSNLAAFFPPLSSFDTTFAIELGAAITKDRISVTSFRIGEPDNLTLNLSGVLTGILEKGKLNADIDKFSVKAAPDFLRKIPTFLSGSTGNETLTALLAGIGALNLDMEGRYDMASGEIALSTLVNSGAGDIKISGKTTLLSSLLKGAVSVEIPALSLAQLLPKLPLQEVRNANFDIEGAVNLKDLMSSSGSLNFSLGEMQLLNRTISGVAGQGAKESDLISLNIDADDPNLNGSIDASVLLAAQDTQWNLEARVNEFDTYSAMIMESAEKGYDIKGDIKAFAIGNNIDNLKGELTLSNFYCHKWEGETLNLDHLRLASSIANDGERQISLESEILDAGVSGLFTPSEIPSMAKRTLAGVFPMLFEYDGLSGTGGEGSFIIAIKNAKPLIDFFSLPVFPLTAINIKGSFDSSGDLLTLNTDIPYIQQGKNNLITDTYVDVRLNGEQHSLSLNAGTIYPTKKGLLKMDLDVAGEDGDYNIALDLNRGRNVKFDGQVDLRLHMERNEERQLVLDVNFLPSTLHLNDTEWKLEESEIIYSPSGLWVDQFCVRHDQQFVLIDGTNLADGTGQIMLQLADIDVDYVFGTLNIPHVTFGGTATGKVLAERIFSGNPNVQTLDFNIHNMSYNGAVLGDGAVSGRLDLPGKMVAIAAKIKEGSHLVADVDGGVWFGRDSLSFNFIADSVNIAFMQPFMSAFSSDVKGRASGEALLHGTFSDIDMTGTIVANYVDILIDYINARYTGSDTVYLYPGRIEIPDFQVKDKYGNTALVNGTLKHRYFHEPEFNFRITDMRHLLVYDTNAKINPLWYGTIFASGAGEIVGAPGYVDIAADVVTGSGSDFTFVLSDQQEAVKSHFLTFSDRRKAEREALQPKDTVPEFLARFRKQQAADQGDSDIFSMDFRVSVTDGIKFNLVMDPIAGDKITAFGDGAMTLAYTSLTDELRLYGKYILDKGTYNFSLQDIILKDFTIKPGSSIAFTGDPYTGILDITAAYRVNTNLTELDQSFANDRELNRTSVPVEALLKVTGPLTTPNIGFDIELPTVTEETAQKVRSIISTDDMMSRQVLYLVALNKFYSPEYMSTTNSGGEWASIASSTLSSQIQNVIGQLTDKFTLAPSIRTDKGDFSDVEFDVALSSQLFNNRLLLNGNLGYRDPSNSSTTFVGDFDLEYLLNRKGTWRLKAYNHFNDQNYYLKSALTTQGIGIVWRKDFGRPKKDRKPVAEEVEIQLPEAVIKETE